MQNLEEASSTNPLASWDMSDDTGAQGACVDSVGNKDSDHGTLLHDADNPSIEEPDIPSRTSISSDDSTCSSLISDNSQFYYFYQGKTIQDFFSVQI